MRKQRLVEYTLTPDETQQAILEFIARKEGVASTPPYRYVRFVFERTGQQGKASKPFAVALTEEPRETIE